MRTIAVDINGTDYRARILNHEDNWEPAALRAVQKRFGKAAAVWRWTLDSREVDQQGNTVRVGYRGTVVGKADRCGGGPPILAEARIWLGMGDG